MKPTLLDVARQAGVSSSTVSLVFSQKGKISKTVQEKVRAAAEDLGYTKGLAHHGAKTKTVAVLFHFDRKLSHTWNNLRQITLKLQEQLHKNHYLTVLIPITYDMDEDEIYGKVIKSQAVAVFSMHFGREALFRRFEDSSIPVVIIINSQFQTQFHTVCADNFQGSYEAASHLLKLGHKNIIYAEFDIYQLPSTLGDRFLGFYKAMKEHGVDLPDEHRLSLDINDTNDIRNKLETVFNAKARPTAIFFVDDYLAVHSLGALEKLGLSYPGDVSIIASGEVLDYSEPYVPKITTMSTNPELLGKYSAEMMLNRLDQKSDDRYVLKIKQELTDRESCRALSQEAFS
jgi:LacI family transcriptional regulator